MAPSGLLKRSLSAALLAPLALFVIWFGSPAVEILAALMAFQLGREWGGMTLSAQAPAARHAVGIGAGASVIAAAVLSIAAGVGFAVLGTVVAWVLVRIAREPNGLLSGVGVAYAGISMIALMWIGIGHADGTLSLLWLILVVWATDIFAYIAGRTIGGPKLAPSISPKKTWAGLGGGVLAAALVGGGFAFVVGSPTVLLLAATGAVTAIVAQAGDLLESALKRYTGVKDSGGLIPGHGGLFDRLDGVMAAAPVLALIIWYMERGPLDWIAAG